MGRIFVDVDGVLADTHASWLRVVNDRYEEALKQDGLYPYRRADITRYDFGGKARRIGLSVEDCAAIIRECWDTVSQTEDFSFIPRLEEDVAARLAALRGIAPVDIVTANPRAGAMQQWCDHYSIPYDRFLRHEAKHELTVYTGIVEDHPYLAPRIADARPREDFLYLLRDQPYNQDAAGHPAMQRIQGLDEAAPRLETHLQPTPNS